MSDGALVFATGAWGAKLHEVAPYVTKVNFGAMFAGGLAMNKSVFDKLPPEVQKALREAADVWAVEYVKRQGAAVAMVLQNMTAAGAKISELSPAERKRWADALGPVAKTWAADVHGQGRPRRPGAEGLHRRAEEGRHASCRATGRPTEAAEPRACPACRRRPTPTASRCPSACTG